MWACFAHDDSKSQTALGSAISGPPFGPFLEPSSSMFAQISFHFVLFLAGCFQHSNSPRICDFRLSFWTLFGAMFFKLDAKFLLCGLASCKALPKLSNGHQYAPGDHLQGPPEPAKTQRKPQRPTPALPLGRHRRSHIDFNIILLTVAWFWKVASPKPSYSQQFHPKP